MTTLKDTVALLNKNWEQISFELRKLNDDLSKAQRRKAELLSQLDGLLKTFDLLKQRPADLIIPPELRPNRKVTIGDFIEGILQEYGELTRAEIEVYLRQRNVGMNLTNARIIIATAIKRDARQRFRVLENGKVTLRKENE
jgi:hypothetical protein